jgi:hypothetical protein
MRFLCVRQPTRANIFGEEFDLKPLDSRLENIQDILELCGVSKDRGPVGGR